MRIYYLLTSTSYEARKNLALQDSTPASGCEATSTLLPQCDPAQRAFYVIGDSRGISYDIKMSR